MENSNLAAITVKQEPKEPQNQEEDDRGSLAAVQEPVANIPQHKSRNNTECLTAERAWNTCGPLTDEQELVDSCVIGHPAAGLNDSSRNSVSNVLSEPLDRETHGTSSARFPEPDIGSQQQDCPSTVPLKLKVKNEDFCPVIPEQKHPDGSRTEVSGAHSEILSRQDGREMSALERRYFYGSQYSSSDHLLNEGLGASRRIPDVHSGYPGNGMVQEIQRTSLNHKPPPGSVTMIHESGVAIRCQEDLLPQENKETKAFDETSAATSSINEEVQGALDQKTCVDDQLSRCKICHKSVIHIKSHMKVHTSDRPFKCSVCEKGFIEQRHLDNHMRSHTGEKPFKCHVCQKAFSRETHLTYHLRTHTGIKPFSCETCGRSFSRKGDLTVHMRIHTGERPFPCKVCEKTCSTQSNLTLHMRSHTGERPYKCTACPKTFKSKSDLIKHVRVHTGEKPFKCKVCDRYFRATSDLKRHMRGHTNEKPYKCEVCLKEFSSDCYLPKHVCSGASKTKNVSTENPKDK